MNSNKFSIVVVIIAMIIVYIFIVVNVFIGLISATALQGFCGILLMLVGLVGLVAACFNVHKLFN